MIPFLANFTRNRLALTAGALLLFASAILLLYSDSLGFTFWTDDWYLVGPPIWRDVLDHPISYLTGIQGVGHFIPLALANWALQSALFGANPVPYHLVNLCLMLILCLAMWWYLREKGLPFAISALSVLSFTTMVFNVGIVAWISASNYILVGLFMMLALRVWNQSSSSPEKRPVFKAYLFGLLALLSHSIGVIVPVLFGIESAFRRDAGQRRRGVILSLIGMLLFAAVALIPRLFVERGEGGKASLFSFVTPHLGNIIAGMSGALKTYVQDVDLLGGVFGWAITVLFIMLVVAWIIDKDRRWDLLFLGLGVILCAILLPALYYSDTPELFASRLRYRFIPHIGIALTLSALLHSAFTLGLKRFKPLLVVPVAYLAAFGSYHAYGVHLMMNNYRIQDAFVRNCVQEFTGNFSRISAKSDCGKIIVIDRPLEKTAPADVKRAGNYAFWMTNHKDFFRLYFSRDRALSERVSFQEGIPSGTIDQGACLFIFENGRAMGIRR